MYQVKSGKLLQNISTSIVRVIKFIGTPLFSEEQSNENPNLITRANHRNSDLSAGGYNEAFIMQQWASYGPRH
jgi:hypothetical protein